MPNKKPKKTWITIKTDYETKLQKFQEKCPHKKLSDWVEQYFAPGHFSGCYVKCCLRCNKVIERQKGEYYDE